MGTGTVSLRCSCGVYPDSSLSNKVLRVISLVRFPPANILSLSLNTLSNEIRY